MLHRETNQVHLPKIYEDLLSTRSLQARKNSNEIQRSNINTLSIGVTLTINNSCDN